jgi:hypothetical protein
VAFASSWRGVVDEFADRLADAAGKDDLGGLVGEWLLDKDEVDDVFADDRALGRVVLQHARALAAEAKARRAEAEAAASDEPDDSNDDAEAATRAAWLARWLRRPFLPKTRPGDGPASASKFCGTALLLPGEAWPVCPGCEQPMQLFVQLDLAELPAELAHPHREGMVQLFYCTNPNAQCEVDHEAWQPFGKSTRARWLSPAQQAQAAAAAPTPDPVGKPAAVVVGWEPGPAEAPGYEEDVPPPPDSLEDVVAASEPRGGDKLGGWPLWVQGPEYPRCPQCKARMAVLVQLDSNGLCHHQFGDLGVGHLSQCPTHPEVVAFGWACS